MTRAVAMATLAALVAAAQPAAANPVDEFGLGARAMGLAGAYGALVDDFSANYYNPAALASGDDLRIEIGYVFVAPSLALNGQDLDVDGVHGTQGGVVLPGRLFGHRVGVSVGVYLPDERVTRLRSLPESQPRFVLYDNRPQRLYVASSLAVEVIKNLLFVGAGFTALSDTTGQLDVSGTVDFQDAAGTTLFSAVDVNFVAARYVSAGLLVTPGDNLRFGLAFRDEFELSARLGLVVEADIVTGGATDTPSVLIEDGRLEVFTDNSNLFSPRQLSFSAAWLGQGYRLAAELAWLQWSRFVAPTATIAIDLDVPGLGLSVPDNPAPQPTDFNDILVPRIGAEVDVVDLPTFGLTLRAGYFYEPTPAPDQPGVSNYVDADRHGFATGLTLRFSELGEVMPKPFYIDLAGQFILMTSRDYVKDDPADPVGDFTAEGHFMGFSATGKFLF